MLPYLPQYPLIHSQEDSGIEQEEHSVPDLHCHSLVTCQPFPFPDHGSFPQTVLTYGLRYNALPQHHHHPWNRSYHVHQSGFLSYSMSVPYIQEHHRWMSHHAGDIYPLFHRQYAHTSCMVCPVYYSFHSLRTEFFSVQVLNHL